MTVGRDAGESMREVKRITIELSTRNEFESEPAWSRTLSPPDSTIPTALGYSYPCSSTLSAVQPFRDAKWSAKDIQHHMVNRQLPDLWHPETKDRSCPVSGTCRRFVFFLLKP